MLLFTPLRYYAMLLRHIRHAARYATTPFSAVFDTPRHAMPLSPFRYAALPPYADDFRYAADAACCFSLRRQDVAMLFRYHMLRRFHFRC